MYLELNRFNIPSVKTKFLKHIPLSWRNMLLSSRLRRACWFAIASQVLFHCCHEGKNPLNHRITRWCYQASEGKICKWPQYNEWFSLFITLEKSRWRQIRAKFWFGARLIFSEPGDFPWSQSPRRCDRSSKHLSYNVTSVFYLTRVFYMIGLKWNYQWKEGTFLHHIQWFISRNFIIWCFNSPDHRKFHHFLDQNKPHF